MTPSRTDHHDEVAALRLLRESFSGIRSYVAAVERLERSEQAVALKGLLVEHVDAGRILRPFAKPDVPAGAPLSPVGVEPWPEFLSGCEEGPASRAERRTLEALRDGEAASLDRFVNVLHEDDIRRSVRDAALEVLLPRQRRRIERLERLIKDAATGARAPSTRRARPAP